MSIILEDIDALGSPAPHKVYGHNDHPANQWNKMWLKESSEDADGMVASVLCTAATNDKA
jgi:hypothetical protein